MNFFFGNFGDQVGLFWLLWWEKNHQVFSEGKGFTTYIGSPEGFNVLYSSSEPIIFSLLRAMAGWVGEVHAFNVIILLTIFLNLVISYFFFKKYFERSLSFVLSCSFAFSTIFWNHFSEHLSLSQLWIAPLTLILLGKKFQSFKDHFFFAVYASLIFLVSNYYGFFVILALALRWFFELVGMYKRKEVTKSTKLLFGSVVFCFTYLTITLIGISGFLTENFYSEKVSVDISVERPVEDFFIFSAKPWNYFLPSPKNPIFGSISVWVTARLQSTGYFLFNNYFAPEHSSQFIGYPQMLLFGLFLLLLLRRKIKIQQYDFLLLLLLVGFIVVSLPPFFTINNFKVYTPSSLIAGNFRMFRVLARTSVFILAILLYFSGVAFSKLTLTPQRKKLMLVMILVLNLFGFFVPFRLTPINSGSKTYEYLKSQTPVGSSIAVYPYKEANKFLFYMREHHRKLVNPRDYYTETFNSPIFTSNLVIDEGLNDAKLRGVSYIVVYKTASDEDLNFFENTNYLTLLESFEDAKVFKLN